MVGKERLARRKFVNFIQSALLLGGMTLLLAGLGWTLGGGKGVFWAAAAGLVLLWLSPRLSPRLALRMYGAHPLPRADAPELHALVEDLAQRAELPYPPVLYYVPTPVMNAFTVGNRAESAIGVTDGLLRRLSLREVAGVLAHEISHIRNNDMWVMGLADLMSRMTGTLSFFGQLLVLINLPLLLFGAAALPWLPILILVAAPAVSVFLHLALSRTREYDADLDGASLTGDPLGLASALAKLERYQGGLLNRIFFPVRGVPDLSALRTHPRTERRVRRLVALARNGAVVRPASHLFSSRDTNTHNRPH